jgi:hypothetical protein
VSGLDGLTEVATMAGVFAQAAVVTACFVWLSASASAFSQQQAANGPRPSASEVFHLRSECAALVETILDGNLIGRALTQSVSSH